MTKSFKVLRRVKRRKKSIDNRSVRIPGPMWLRVEAVVQADPQFAATRMPVGRALAMLLNEKLLEREAAIQAKAEGA